MFGGKVAKQKHAPGDSSRDLFGMVSLRDPFCRGCWWPPTFGDQKVTAWITRQEPVFGGTSAARKKCCVHWRSVESHLWCYFPFRYFMWVSWHRTRFSYPEHEKLHFFLEDTIHKKIGASLLDDDQLLLSQEIGETCLHRPIIKIGGRKDFQGECSLRK